MDSPRRHRSGRDLERINLGSLPRRAPAHAPRVTMKHLARSVLIGGVLAGVAVCAAAQPTAGKTTILGPFTGHYAPLHPDNEAPHRIRYYGTDLGWSYEHQGKIHFLFGDTSATEDDERIQASTGGRFDDSFGTVDLAQW